MNSIDQKKMLKKKSGPQTGIIILNSKGEILLQRRDNNNNIPFPDKLGTFGGAIEAGENPEHGLKRELSEEINGYEFNDIKFWKKFLHKGYEEYIFVIKEPNLDINKIKVLEGQRAEWISEEYVKNNPDDFAFDSLEIILDYFRNNRKIKK